MSALTDLYFQVYPEHDGADLHWFMQGHGIGICIDEEDCQRNTRGHDKAQQFLSRKLWEKQTGETLDPNPA